MLDYIKIDDRIRVREPLELLNIDVSVNVLTFDDNGLLRFRAEFRAAHESGQDIIPIVIDSDGGDINALFAMIDLMNTTDKPIATIVLGRAYSAGAVLLSCGTKGLRFAAPNSSIMLHDVSTATAGKVDEVEVITKYLIRQNKKIFKLVESNCGMKPGELGKKIDKLDLFLSPNQAKSIGLIDFVKVPRFVTEVKVETVIL